MMVEPQSLARFVTRRQFKEPPVPFLKNRALNDSHTEERTISARRICAGHMAAQSAGFGAVNLQEFLNDGDGWDDRNDEKLRGGISEFWKSPPGRKFLSDRFLSQESLHVFPTHVTRRKAPPEQMELVHIDYPASHDLETLWNEWEGRWQSILPPDFVKSYKLRGVLTVWVALSDVTDFPLWVADAATVNRNEGTVVYKVGKRSSVGVYYDHNIAWYTIQDMKRCDAWIFDTQQNPHVAVSLPLPCQGRTLGRKSAEVRCLVVEARIV